MLTQNYQRQRETKIRTQNKDNQEKIVTNMLDGNPSKSL